MATTTRKGTVNPAARPRAVALAVATAFLPWWSLPHTAYGQTPPPPAANQMPSVVRTHGDATVHDAVGTYQKIDQASRSAVYAGSLTMGVNAHLDVIHAHGRSGMGLFKDVSGSLTQIFGRITSNGQIFISNQNGVLFGASARVDVGSLFATSLSINDLDFMAGRYNWVNEGKAGEVANEAGKNKGIAEGHIITANGYTALVGPQVRNDGIIVARAGLVTLAAADRVSVDMIGDGLISLSIDQAALNASVINKGRIEADGGTVLLTARSANALLDTVINNSGTIRANSLVERDGQIVLDGGTAGVVSVTGTMQAAGVDAGTTGGTIKVLGDKVGLFGKASVDASGDMGGGTVLVGGNWQGQGSERNASAAFMSSGASISADARTSGNGGTVVVWSDGSTRAYGSISARGGEQSGNGGSVETSGHYLDVAGARVDTRAPNGATGGWLLDPFDVTIVDGLATTSANGAFGGGNPKTWTPSATGSTVADGDIALNLVTANVTITTVNGAGAENGDITVNSDVSIAWVTANTLTLNAERNVTVLGNATFTGATGTLAFNVGQANGGGILTIPGTATLSVGTVNAVGGTGNDTFNIGAWGTGGSVNGVAGNDTFNINTSLTANLAGGADADNFVFANGAVLTGTVDGGAGSDTLDLSAYTTALTVSLNAAGATDGANGTTAGTPNPVSGGFSNIDVVSGGTNGDTFNINASVTANLSGNGGADSFVFGDTFALTGTIDGGAGSDTINWSAYAAGRSVVLTATGATDGFNGTEASVSGGFSNIDVLSGSAGADSLTGMNAVATWGIDGSNTYTSTNTLSFSSFETLSGGNDSDTFNISGAQTHTLSGGAGADSFVFADAATLTGTIDGNAGSDTINWSAYAAGRSVVLTASGAADGFNGTEASVSGGFSNIDVLSGSAGADSLTGINAVATWGIDGSNTYTSTNTLSFSSFETLSGGNDIDTFNISGAQTHTLSGGAGADSFVFADAATLTGTIDGNAGSDTLNLSAYTTALTVNLNAAGATDGANGTTAGTPNPVSGGFSNIDVVSGGTNGDTFNINSSVTANLSGNAGADSFVFGDTFALAGTIDGDAGIDTISWAAYTTGRSVTLSATGATDGFNGSEASVTSFANIDTLTGSAAIDTLTGFATTATWGIDGTNTYTSGANTLTFANFENLTGGGGVDTFNVTAAHAGDLSGGAGVDVFNLDATLTGSIDGQIDGGTLAGTQVVNATLTAAGGTAGFNGTSDAAALVGTFNNITTINANGGGTLTGLNTVSSWDVDAGSYTDTVSTRTLSHSGFGSLQGGSAIDTFTLSANAAANLAGGDGVDVFDMGGFTLTGSVAGQAAGGTLSGVVNATLTATGATTGFNGSSTEVSLGFSDINTINGTGTLQGLNTVSTWDVDANIYTDTVSTRTLSHSGFATLQGGSAIDTFSVSAAVSKNLSGGDGVDVFNLDAALTGTIDGQIDGGTLAGTQVVNATLTAAGGTAGFNGTSDAAALVGTFNNITTINANGGGTFTGLNTVSSWDVDANTYTDTVSTRTLSHSGFATLQGGSAIDTFNVSAVATKNLAGGGGVDVFNLDAALTGTIDGQAAGGTLAGTQVVNATLTAAGGTAGFNGTTDAAALVGTFSNITTINANGGGTLTGLNTVSSWDVDANTYTDTVSTRTLSHSGFATLQGGSASDTFNVSALATKNLAGGDGVDVFNLDAALTGTIDGQAAGGTLAGTQVVNATLTASGGTAGFNGTTDATALVGTFSNITTINANGAGTLTGLNTVSTWDVDAGSYTDTVSTRTLSHSGFATLQGGSAIDAFTLSANATANLAGGDAVDVFDMGGFTLTGSVAGQAAGGTLSGVVNATLTATAATTGFNGSSTEVSLGFSDINTINGTGTLQGLNTASTWALDGTPTYSDGTRTLDIAGFANLQGGTAADTFSVTLASTFNVLGGAGADVFTINAALTGSVSGEGGSDILQGTQIGGTTLTSSTAADGFSGTTTGMAGFSGIDVLNGSGTLTGRDVASTWSVDGATYTDGAATLTHSGFGTLQGGTAIDTFNLAAAASANLLGGDGADVFNIHAALTGSVNGQVGNDSLNGSTTYVVNAANAGTASNVSAGFSNIENLAGTAGADAFSLSGAGTLAGTIDGLAGTDTLTGNNVANAWTITGPNSGTLTGTGGWSNIENLVGGTSTDSFSGVPGGSVGGTISDGGGGATTLSGTINSVGSQTYSAAVSSAGVTLNAGTAAISATNAGNNFTGTLDVTGSSASITDMNALTIDASLTGGLITNSGALTYVAGMSVGSLTSTASGAVNQSGAITVTGATNINAGGNAITLTSANDFQSTLSLVGGTTQVRDANALTLGNVSVGALTTINTGALNLGTLNASSLTATTNGGNITQSGPANVAGATSLQAGSGSIVLPLANDFGGVVAASGIGITLNDVNTLAPGTINAGSGSVNLSANSLGAGGTVSAGSASSFSSNTNVNGLDINMPNVPLALSGAATQWNFTSTPTSIPQPNPVTVPGGNVGVTYNLASIIASVAQQQAASASSSVSATVAAVIVDEANKTFGTDSVAEDVEYGFAGEVGATPPMDHRIDESGISLPRCVEESREGMPCK